MLVVFDLSLLKPLLLLLLLLMLMLVVMLLFVRVLTDMIQLAMPFGLTSRSRRSGRGRHTDRSRRLIEGYLVLRFRRGRSCE